MGVLTANYNSILPENELLALAQEGNEDAFSVLVRQNYSMIYKISRRVLKNHEDAEDTLQNVLTKVYQRLGGFEGQSRFSTWLFRVTVNEAMMTLRRNRSRKRECVFESRPDDDGTLRLNNISASTENGERQYVNRDLARKAMLRLSPVLRGAFFLHEGEGWTHQEMATALGITLKAAKSRVHRARRRLREELKLLT